MAHARIEMKVSDDWVLAQAEREPESGITSVGGGRQVERPATTKMVESSRLSLARFVELSRRRMRLTVEQFAERTDIDLAELLTIEKGEDIVPEARTIYQLAREFQVKPESLLELAGLVSVKESRLGEAAVRFAARSEPMVNLSPEEEAALNWFVKELAKP